MFWQALRRAIRHHSKIGIGIVFGAVLLSVIIDHFKGRVQESVMDLIGRALPGADWISGHPVEFAVIAGVLFVCACAILATRDEWIRKLAEYANEAEPAKMEVLWKPKQLTYEHRFSLSNKNGVSIENTLFRVCIHNASQTKTIEKVRVRMESLDPPELPCVPTYLLLMNDNTTPHKDTFDIGPGDFRFIDVIQYQRPDQGSMYIWHITPRIGTAVKSQSYTFAISARSKTNVVTRVFRIVPVGDGHWAMEDA